MPPFHSIHRQWSAVTDLWGRSCLPAILRKVNRTSLWRHVPPSLSYRDNIGTSWDSECQRAAERQVCIRYLHQACWIPLHQHKPGFQPSHWPFTKSFSAQLSPLLLVCWSLYFSPFPNQRSSDQLTARGLLSCWKPTYVHWYLRCPSWSHLKIGPQKLQLIWPVEHSLQLPDLRIVLASDCTSQDNLPLALLHLVHIALSVRYLTPQQERERCI